MYLNVIWSCVKGPKISSHQKGQPGRRKEGSPMDTLVTCCHTANSTINKERVFQNQNNEFYSQFANKSILLEAYRMCFSDYSRLSTLHAVACVCYAAVVNGCRPMLHMYYAAFTPRYMSPGNMYPGRATCIRIHIC